MGSRLLNVRLDPNRIRKAARLRERGITLSDVVRDAIDARFAALTEPLTASGASAVIDRQLQDHPDPPGTPRRTYDVHDARAARAAIRRALGRRRT